MSPTPGPNPDSNPPSPSVDPTCAESPRSLPEGGSSITPDDVSSGPARPATVQVPGYTILAELGRGGMGVVYRARQSTLGRVVALKMILAGDHAGEQSNARFLAEAAVIARLKHPHIVQVHDFGTVQGQPFFSLEYCEGGSLAQQLATAPLEARPAAELLRQLAQGVQAAHEAGVIHRDLKPANVLLTAAGPKITDFGIAKRQDAVLTATDVILGTPAYMAPEQTLDASKVDARADVYSLGAMLYECLTGRPPFRTGNVVDTLELVRNRDPVPPRQLQPGVPVDLETICLKCLRKEPARRYASAAALADDLGRFLDGRPISARPVGRLERAWKWVRRNRSLAGLYAVSALAVVVLIGVGFVFSARLGAARGDLAAAEAERRLHEAEADRARELTAVSEYFRLVNQVRERNLLQPPDWVRASQDDLKQAAPLLPGPEHLPALRSVAAACLGGVTLREPKRVAVGTPVSVLAYTPDGKTLVLGRSLTHLWASCSILFVDVASGKTVRQLPFNGSATWQAKKNTRDGVRSLAVSPDGRWLVAGMRSGWLHRWDLRQDAPTVVSWEGHASLVNVLAFSHDGTALYSVAKEESLKRWDATTWKETAASPAVGGTIASLVCDHSGEWVAQTRGGAVLDWLNGMTLQPQRASAVMDISRLAVSPDGRCLFSSSGDVLRMLDLVNLDVLAHFRQPGAENAHDDSITDLAVSPDGTLLASSCDTTHHVRLWDVASGRLLADVHVGGGTVQLAFSPDGRALGVCGETGAVLYELPTTSRNTTALAPRPLLEATWLAGQPLLAVLAQSGPSDAHQFAELGVQPVDAPEGNGLATLSPALAFVLEPYRVTALPMALRADRREAAWLLDDGVARLNPERNSLLRWLGMERPEAVQFGPDGRCWTCAGNKVQAWSFPEGKELVRWTSDLAKRLSGEGGIRALHVGRQRVAAGIRDGSVSLLDAAEGRYLQTIRVDEHAVQAISFDVEELLAVFGTEGGAVGLLELETGKLLAVRKEHRDSVDCVAFVTPEVLASGSRDRTVRLWHWREGRLEEILSLPFSGPVRRITGTADGARLAVLVHGERAVRVWRVDQLRTGLAALGIDPGLPDVKPMTGPWPPSPWFLPTELPRGQGRVRVDLFQGAHLERRVRTRYDPRIEADWGDGDPAPDPALQLSTPFSARWTGWLRPPVAGEYVLSLDHTNIARLWLDGKLLLDSDRSHPNAVSTVTVPLDRQGHALRVEYRNSTFPARCRLSWKPPAAVNPEGASLLVPGECLFPDRKTMEQAP